jgi:hypothetical protein
VSDYIRNISVIKHKDSKSDRTPSPERERRLSLTKIESNNPVSQAANYSPEHIAEIAYKMAAKSIPATAEERRKRREQLEKEYQQGQKDPAANGVKPGRTMSRNKALFSGTKKKHSKAHDAAIETGHFVDNMLEVGLKGKFRNRTDLHLCLQVQYLLPSFTTSQMDFTTFPPFYSMITQSDDETTSQVWAVDLK